MSAAEKAVQTDMAHAKQPAYDPNNLHPIDADARKYDDTSEGIDWDDIIATTQDDWEARRFAFDSDDYPTEKEAMAAMDRMMEEILQEVLLEAATKRELDASRK